MDVVRTIASVPGYLHQLVSLIENNKKRGDDLADGLKSMKKDFEMMISARADGKQLQSQPAGLQLQLQELAYDIDDFIHNIWVPGPCGVFILTATGMDSRPRLIQSIGRFEKHIKTLGEELAKVSESTKHTGATPAVCLSSAGSPGDLVGTEGPKTEILELLSPRADPHRGRLSVISILGCNGSGKTALARALFEDEDIVSKFDYKAWVVASDHNSADILNKIEVEPIQPASAPRGPSEALQHFSKDKRYLVFVDDMKRWAPWKDIRNALRENVMDSRIIVTTSFPSVARDCSYGSYVYTMQRLDQQNSRRLFRAKYREEAGYSAEDVDGLGDNDVDIIITKCDGLPMALITAAKCLHAKKALPLATRNFNQVTQDLRDCLTCSESDFEDFKKNCANETDFGEMRRALVEPYEKMLSHGHKGCLLYVSIFPSGHQINSKSLIRRLIAEGLHPKDPHIMKDPKSTVEDVCECLGKLMDQSMIEPVPIRNYSNVAKWCRVHSIMLEFTIKNGVSRNFVSLIHMDQPLHNTIGKVRRLTVQSSPDVRCTGVPKKMGLSALRSLAIFKSGILDFEECKLVRVLDLEGCSGLTPEVLGKMCGLLFLQYLSLRNTDIRELPENVKKLKCLETLDTRGAVVVKLPVEVTMLPQLAYLFGKFELNNVHHKNRKKLNKFFSEKRSQLRTLGGISVYTTQDLEIVALVVNHAINLKKVKVWFKDTPRSTGPGYSRLVNTLESILIKRSRDLESVSIDFNGVSNNFLDFVKTVCTISSIKLRRVLGCLPARAELEQVRNLKKLHLFSTGCGSEQLGSLQHLKCLQYLKLAEDGHGLWHSAFHLKVGGFISLIWLCFEASNSKHPPLKIDEGVKTPLTSLRLLCKEIHPCRETGELLRVEGISHLPKLSEVILHNSASDDTVKAWKEEAKRHINMPYVEKQQV